MNYHNHQSDHNHKLQIIHDAAAGVTTAGSDDRHENFALFL